MSRDTDVIKEVRIRFRCHCGRDTWAFQNDLHSDVVTGSVRCVYCMRDIHYILSETDAKVTIKDERSES